MSIFSRKAFIIGSILFGSIFLTTACSSDDDDGGYITPTAPQTSMNTVISDFSDSQLVTKKEVQESNRI